MTDAQSGANSVPYIKRTHDYYTAQGFEQVYRYAHHTATPLTALPRPLSECTVGLVTTASLCERAPLEPRSVGSSSTDQVPSQLFTNDLSWDKEATHTDDVNSFCPIETLKELVADGKIGALGPRFHCAPTDYSQKTTIEQDAPEILRRLRDDGADIALLVPL